MSEELRLTARSLACRRGDRVLFSGFDLALSAGDIVWLRAANGYGKTSLLRVLAGLARPEEGSIERHDQGAHAMLYLAHANALKDDLTVLESLQYAARLHGVEVPDGGLTDTIRRFGLQTRRHAPIRTLSQGQRRRVALMRLTLSPPAATWLLDEPFDALDSEGSTLVGTLLAEHAQARGSVLLTSHIAPALDPATIRVVQLDSAA